MIIPKNTKRLFWDAKIRPADMNKYRDFIITRVAEKGGLTDLRWLAKTYGKKNIKMAVKKSYNVSDKTKNFWNVI